MRTGIVGKTKLYGFGGGTTSLAGTYFILYASLPTRANKSAERSPVDRGDDVPRPWAHFRRVRPSNDIAAYLIILYLSTVQKSLSRVRSSAKMAFLPFVFACRRGLFSLVAI